MSNITVLDEIVRKYSSDMDIIQHITPRNLNEENEKFLRLFHSGVIYNPQYRYDTIPRLDEAEQAIAALEFGDSGIEAIYRDYQRYLLQSIWLLRSVGDAERFTAWSAALFGQPDESLKEKAMAIFAEHGAVITDDTPCSPEDLKHCMEKAIQEHGFAWSVSVVDKLTSKVAVDPDEKTVWINSNVRFSRNDVRRLLVHEFGTHIVRAENGSRQKYHIFQNGFPKSIETEEGLAAYNEWKHHLLDIRTLKIYAGRVLAVDLCQNDSFYEAFVRLKDHFPEEECVRMISRVKRGLTDTAQKGAFTKDFIYLNGFYQVKERINPEKERILYTGIIGLDDVDRVRQLPDIIYKA